MTNYRAQEKCLLSNPLFKIEHLFFNKLLFLAYVQFCWTPFFSLNSLKAIKVVVRLFDAYFETLNFQFNVDKELIKTVP